MIQRPRRSAGGPSDLTGLEIFALQSLAGRYPYIVFVECERRLEEEGYSEELSSVASMAGTTIENLLLTPQDSAEMTSAYTEFAMEMDETIDANEPEEGVNKAMAALERRLARFG